MKTQDLLKTVVAVPTHVVVVVARVAPDLSRVTFLKLRIMKCVKVKITGGCKKKVTWTHGSKSQPPKSDPEP